MIRIQPNANPDAKAQEMLAKVNKMFGSTPNIFKTLAHSSTALNYYLSGAGALNDAKLGSALREQIALTVAGANSCDYCASAHTALGKTQKIPDGELALNLEAKSENVRTQAILTFSRKIVDARGQVSDEDVKVLRAAGVSDGEIVEMVAVVAQNIFTNYFNHIAGTAIDFPVVKTTEFAMSENESHIAK